MRRSIRVAFVISLLGLSTSPTSGAQSFNASLSGTAFDETGAVVPHAELKLINSATGIASSFMSDQLGRYSFQNLPPGTYELRASVPGFREYRQSGIELNINIRARVNVQLQLGTTTERVDVIASPVLMNFENPTHEAGFTPDTLGELPLLMNGGIRSSAGLAVLLPGVTSGGGNDPFDARFNGGTFLGDEAVVDGVTMQQGTMSQSGMISLFADFPYSPDMVSEVRVLTANYEPQYGGTSGAVIIADTKSGTQEFHGSAFWFHRNSALNARPWGQEKPFNLQHNYGFALGGPNKIPGLWSDKVKSFFYVDYEGFRANGGTVAPILSIPSMKNRAGDFTDWVDGSGSLIPVYDPFTTRENPDYDSSAAWGPDNLPYLRDRFMGCDGNSPNVICPDRISDSWAHYWLKHLPNTTWNRPVQNYQAPAIPSPEFFNSGYFFARLDSNIGEQDHLYLSIYHQDVPAVLDTTLPEPVANESVEPSTGWVNRLNWAHTFSPSLIHHFSLGYLNRTAAAGSINQDFVDDFPKVPGVAGYPAPAAIILGNGFAGYGSDRGSIEENLATRPAVVGSSLLTWVKGGHVFKFGAEYRNLGQNMHDSSQEAGLFYFGPQTTGLWGVYNSGSPIASFLLETVTWGGVTFRDVKEVYPRQEAFALHFSDTWKVTSRLSLNYGLRWDLFTPAVEKHDRLSFFDPTLPNPGAGGRLGALAFVPEFEQRMGRRHPEETWRGGFAPRVGAAWTFDDKTVIRAGYGIFIHQAYCPGWQGCMAQDGYLTAEGRLGPDEGIVPAFILREGFPQDFEKPPYLEPDYRNGKFLMYRPFEGNRRSYAQHWNLTLERELAGDLMASVAYVATVGRKLPSRLAAINVLPPEELSRGAESLFSVYEDDGQVIAGVPAPYEGWVSQMAECTPNVAQALVPYPQYCDALEGLNENAGNSSYHSFQVKVNRRFSRGLFLLASYTFGKLMSDSGWPNESQMRTRWQISPYERERARTLAPDDVPQVLSASVIYDLPWQGKKGWLGALLGNWTLTTIFRASSGLPFGFWHSSCTWNIPQQFRMFCLPAITDSDQLWVQDKKHFDPGLGPLFDSSAFEEVRFDGPGTGPPITNERGFGYINHDLSLLKRIPIGEQIIFEFRAEFFNVWNWHTFGNDFGTDVPQYNFGYWSGEPSPPRIIQLGARLEF